MKSLLDCYAPIAGEEAIHQLRLLARPLRGMRVVHVNSTRSGGGVAEILHVLVPLMQQVGLDAQWRVMAGDTEFFGCTKRLHNALQGSSSVLPPGLPAVYERANRENAEALRGELESADVVFIHDPQPAAILQGVPRRRGKWIWRCHIDVSHPFRQAWRYLRTFVAPFDASIYSLEDFAQSLPHPQFLIPPSIDPLSDKNVDLPAEEVAATCAHHALDPARPIIVQISRFDRFKDPLGVIGAYRLAKDFVPGLQLVLAGGTATDDPESDAVLAEVRAAAAGDGDVHILELPPDAHRAVNALQRAAHIVLQKSLREGFGLTVTEALWKGKAVIGGDTGGIRLQVVDHHTGFLVSSPEGAALRIRYLLHHRDRLREMGEKAHAHARQNFLITRQLREYLTAMLILVHGIRGRIELS